MKVTKRLAGLAVLITLTTGSQLLAQDTANKGKLTCKLFQVQPDQKQVSVIQGEFGSGIRGNDPNAPAEDENAKRYTFKVTDQTNIHWESGGKGKIPLDQLQRMSQQRLIIPMMVYYPETTSLDEKNPVAASEIVLKGSPPQNQEGNR